MTDSLFNTILKNAAGNSPLAAALLFGIWLFYKMIKAHLKSVSAMFQENIEARRHTREALEKNSQVLGENTATMVQVNRALQELKRQMEQGRGKTRME